MKKEILLLLTTHILLFTTPLPAESRLTLGRPDGFGSLAAMEGVRVVPGPEGEAELVLKDLQAASERNTDLLLSFDENPIRDSSSGYEARNEKNAVLISTSHKMRGNGSAAFQYDSRLSLHPRGATLFSPDSTWGDFTIEFWMYPATLAEGETILHWRGAEAARAAVQEVSCRVSGRTLVWRFSDFFRSGEISGKILELKGGTPLVPRTWRHHSLRYDSATGMVEYLVDGNPEAVAYASRSGREDGTLLYPRIGRGGASPLVIGEGFTGFLDEFRITRNYIERPDLAAFSADGGSAEIGPADLGYGGSLLRRIDAKHKTPSNSAVFYSYKIADTYADFNRAEWKPFLPGTPLPPGVKGRFVLLRLELFPDGTRSRSPRVTELTLVYDKNMPPPAPSFAAAFPGDGSIELRWSAVPDPNVQGYLIYYGTKPGVYDGNESGLGPSPLRVGKITSLKLGGLQNGKLYYFVVSAYDGRGDYLSGLFSQEISARPSRLYRNETEEKK